MTGALSPGPGEPPFPLQDTQAYTMAGDDMIVTAFRGMHMHYGFGEALDAVHPDVRDTLESPRG